MISHMISYIYIYIYIYISIPGIRGISPLPPFSKLVFEVERLFSTLDWGGLGGKLHCARGWAFGSNLSQHTVKSQPPTSRLSALSWGQVVEMVSKNVCWPLDEKEAFSFQVVDLLSFRFWLVDLLGVSTCCFLRCFVCCSRALYACAVKRNVPVQFSKITYL